MALPETAHITALVMSSLTARPMEENGIPTRLSKDFIWSTAGTKPVDYPSDTKVFEGDEAMLGRKGRLGSGGFGSVHAMICKGQLLARKRIHYAKNDEEFTKEAEIPEVILHRHIIQLVGSYTLQSRLSILLHPVAECNLKEYIQTPDMQRTPLWRQQLKSAFGCLAAAVAFLWLSCGFPAPKENSSQAQGH
jgi:hypothetical protein